MGENKEFLGRIAGQILYDEPMLNHTTFHIGGPADILVIPENLDDIKYSIRYAQKNCIPLYFIGNGSKLLVSDDGIRGMVIKIGQKMGYIKVAEERIIAGAGTSLSKLVKMAAYNNLGGIEFAHGIPGTLGGAIAMNAGTQIGSMSEIVENVVVLNPTDCLQNTLSKDDCCFGYRESTFQKNGMAILEAKLRLKKAVNNEIGESLIKILERRKRTQPAEKYSAGSVFKNPHGTSAGQLIDSAGLKGLRKGGAKISEVHANFIVNMGNATASDVFFLIKLAQQKVNESFGVALEPEVIHIGDASPK